MEWPGVESRESREALLRALARNVDGWVESAQSAVERASLASEEVEPAAGLLRQRLTGSADMDALKDLLRWAMNGLTHSALVAFDGGSQDCPTMEVRDSDGHYLGDALHEEWPDFAE